MPITCSVDHEAKKVTTVATGTAPECSTTDARATVDLLKALGMVGILLEDFAQVRPFRTNERAEAREWLEGVR